MGSPETVGDLGEFGLIDRIAAIAGAGGAVVGIGDDAAVLDRPGPDYLLVTVDMLLEEVHFRRAAIGAFDLGRRALAVNISDIAAMGGAPAAALTSIALAPETPAADMEELYRGIRAEGDAFGVALVGGNVTRTTGPLTLDITLLGYVPKDELLLRSGAQPGDLLAVTGNLGDAAAARLGADRPSCAGQEWFAAYRREHLVPEPRVREARALAESRLVHAMMDLSDGLASDVQHLARRSQVGALLHVDRLPISAEARRVARELDVDPVDLALGGGEDYELLIALPESALSRARQVVPRLHVVGAVLAPGEGFLIERDDRREPLEVTGWRHF